MSAGRCLHLLRCSRPSLGYLLRRNRYQVSAAACSYHSYGFLKKTSLSSNVDLLHSPSARKTLSTDATLVSRSAKASKPRAVIFDLGGVVVPSPQAIFDRFEEKHGLEPGSLVATIKATGNGGAFAKMERGEYSVEQFCEPFRTEYLSHTKRELTAEQCWEFIQQLSDFTKLTPHSGVMDMFQKLKSQGVKVAILTNNFRWDNGCSVFPEQTLKDVDVVRVTGSRKVTGSWRVMGS